MDADADNMVRQCKKCNQKHKKLPRLEPHPWNESAAPWYTIHLDLFGPINGN